MTWTTTTAVAIAACASVAHAELIYMQTDLEIRYTGADLGDAVRLDIDVDGAFGDDLEFTLLSDPDDRTFEISAAGRGSGSGFLSDDDVFGYDILETFDVGDDFGGGSLTEDEVHAAFEFFDEGQTMRWDGYAMSTVYLGFGFDTVLVDGDGRGGSFGTAYGWMRVEFGELKYEDGSSDVFVRVTEIAYNNTRGSEVVVGEVPVPSALAVIGLGGLAAARRRR